jgi:hypothetical protein
MKAKERYGKTIIYVRIDTKLLKLISMLRDFYGYRTRNELFPYLIILSVLDVATLAKNPKWSPHQIKAWQTCQKMSLSFKNSIALQTAKSILDK